MSIFFFSSRRRHTRSKRDWSSDVCSSDLLGPALRFDIADLSATLTKALTAIDHHRCVFIMPFAITSSTGSDIQRIAQEIFNHARSEERRVGKECSERRRGNGTLEE